MAKINGYTEEEAKVEATCVQQGYTTHTCTICNESYTDTYVEALNHSFTNYISNDDATCLEDGTETSKCERCEETHTRTDEGSTLGHNYKSQITEPTCTEGGYTTHTCTRCQDSYIDAETEALNHSFTNYIPNNDATCLEEGTETAKCDRCEETHTRTDEGSKLAHNYEDGKCTECGEKDPKITITTEEYTVSDKYITQVTDKTTIKEFKEKITTNAEEIKLLNKNNQEQIRIEL